MRDVSSCIKFLFQGPHALSLLQRNIDHVVQVAQLTIVMHTAVEEHCLHSTRILAKEKS